MPSPFPGMDPYLEHPEIFPDLHQSLVFCFREMIQGQLPEPYYAVSSSRSWVEVSQRFIEPDVSVERAGKRPQASGGVALASPSPAKPVLVQVPHDERSEALLQIYTRQGGDRRLVTNIEVLSPSNKAPGEGRRLYLQKQAELLKSEVNLVEIDLLRGGMHSTAVALDWAQAKTGPFDYHVCVHRFDQWGDYLVYPVFMAERLPAIAIPLLPGDADVAVELQVAFDRSYDTGPYHRLIRYADTPPVPPLTAEQSAWATERLREKEMARP